MRISWVNARKICLCWTFFNSVEDIQQAFEPFYTSTSLSQATDVNVLHDLKDQLDETGVYEQAEVNDFTEGYFANKDAQQLSSIIDVAVQRFDHELALEPTQKSILKSRQNSF